MGAAAKLMEHISNQVGVSIFLRSILENRFRAIRTRIRRHLRLGRRLRTLDLGCGGGILSDLFADGQYVGVDLNLTYIDYARRTRKGAFMVGDACKLGLADDQFDQILVFGLLHHLPDEEVRAVLSEACRVLVAGGRILAIEDIPTMSWLNWIGRLIHRLELGKYIRPVGDYRRFYSAIARIESEEIFRSGVCDYYAAVLVP